MDWLNTFFTSGAYLAHLAAICYALGLITRDQVILRTLIFAGTLFYIAYYYIVPEQPLWDAIGWSIILGVCNLYVLVQIALERTTLFMSLDEKTVYARFDKMNPGEFRRLMKMGKWREGDGTTEMTRENEVCHNLYFVTSGQIGISKKGQNFIVTEGGFIGEVGYLLQSPASGTTIAAPGSHYIEWPGKDLAKLELRHPGIRVALRDLLNIDMAGKVARSLGTEAVA